jgi:competence protein ComEC
MWLGMTAAAMGQFVPFLAAVPVALAAYPLGYLTWLAHGAAGVPAASVAASPWLVLGAAVAIAAAISRRAARRAAPALAVIAMALVVALRPAQPPPPTGLRVTFLDVGQGDATLIQDRRASMLVDTGAADGGVVGRLRRAAVRRLDVLLVTHAQADHEGGAAAVLRALPVGVVIDGRDGVRSPEGERLQAVANQRRVRMIPADAGQVVRAGGLELRILHPRREPRALHAGADPNARAVVSVVRYGSLRVLLTADAESEVLSTLKLPVAAVMKVSHHGSADPGLPAVLARVRPALAVISVGARNTYGHPAPATLRALARAVPRVLRTDRDGTVRIDAGAGRMVVSEHA